MKAFVVFVANQKLRKSCSQTSEMASDENLQGDKSDKEFTEPQKRIKSKTGMISDISCWGFSFVTIIFRVIKRKRHNFSLCQLIAYLHVNNVSLLGLRYLNISDSYATFE